MKYETANSRAKKANSSQMALGLGVGTIFVFYGGLGVLAALAPLDGAVIGAGNLDVYGSNKTVQHREGGIVSALLVRDGDKVAQGQVLIRLDDTQVRATMNVHEAQLFGDRALCARDLAELSDADKISFPSDLDPSNAVAGSMIAREQLVFRSHRSLLAGQQRIVDERLAQSRDQWRGATAQHDAVMRGLAFGVQQLQVLTALQHMGLAARNTVLELARSLESLRGETGQLQADLARYGAEIAELEAEKLRLRAVVHEEATHELREAQLRINDVIPRLVADRDIISRFEIRAPVSGQVMNLQVFTPGGVIEPGKPVLQIVPEKRQIVAAVEIRPEDIEHLRIGQSARVVATGFDAGDTPPVDGVVKVISADRMTDPRTGRNFYSVEISLISDHQMGALLRRLGPGMPVEVVVPVKSRTVLEYLIEPLTRSFRSAGREI